MAELFGILGGLGPLASAAFLNTVYRSWRGGPEQTAPRVILYSDPAFPDRTQFLLDGKRDALRLALERSLRVLCEAGASEIVICCMTIHDLCREIAPDLRSRIVSMLDVALELAAASSGKHLLVCSTGTRQMRLFEQHPSWPRVRNRIVMPSEADQERIHELLYRLKQHVRADDIADDFEEMMRRLGADSCLAGCSEMHILASRPPSAEMARMRPYLDPLTAIAARWAGEAEPPARAAALGG
jgi:aspartate racemase